MEGKCKWNRWLLWLLKWRGKKAINKPRTPIKVEVVDYWPNIKKEEEERGHV